MNAHTIGTQTSRSLSEIDRRWWDEFGRNQNLIGPKRDDDGIGKKRQWERQKDNFRIRLLSKPLSHNEMRFFIPSFPTVPSPCGIKFSRRNK
jgi:hypothetical protein